MDYTNSIISGILVFKIGKEYIYITPASAEDKTFADFFAQEEYDEALIDGIWTQSEAEEHLISMGFLPKDHEKELEQMTENIDNMKVDYFNHFYDSTTKSYIKKNLEKQQARYDELHSKKYAFYDKTCDYLKKYCFLSYTLQKNAFTRDKELAANFYPVQLLHGRHVSVVNELSIHAREIAKSIEWKNRWYSSKLGCFENKISSLTDIQLAVISWSTYYEGIYQSMDRPSEELIDDDIAIDGWSIVEKRKRSKEEKQRNAEKMLPENMKNAGEIFIMAKNKKQAEDIMSLNGRESFEKINMLKHDLKQSSVVDEANLTSTRRELQMEAIRMQKENRRR